MLVTNVRERGVYSYSEAAQLTGLTKSRVREWFAKRPASAADDDLRAGRSPRFIGFLDLVEVFIAGQLRNHGLSMRTLRKVYVELRVSLDAAHPFSRKELLTDGRSVFVAGLDKAGEREVTDVLSKQKAFPQIILPFLKKLDFNPETLLAERWRIADGVVVNPGICFGRPVVAEKGIPTHIIASAVDANDRDLDAVARWYDLTVRQVTDAVNFERKRAA